MNQYDDLNWLQEKLKNNTVLDDYLNKPQEKKSIKDLITKKTTDTPQEATQENSSPKRQNIFEDKDIKNALTIEYLKRKHPYLTTAFNLVDINGSISEQGLTNIIKALSVANNKVFSISNLYFSANPTFKLNISNSICVNEQRTNNNFVVSSKGKNPKKITFNIVISDQNTTDTLNYIADTQKPVPVAIRGLYEYRPLGYYLVTSVDNQYDRCTQQGDLIEYSLTVNLKESNLKPIKQSRFKNILNHLYMLGG